jgi:hypothetical protein
MSSSNLVQVAYVAETTYGTAPTPAGTVKLQTARFTSESLSGTPSTTQSAEMRTDRLSSGQVVTGLDVGGDISFELHADTFIDDFLRGAMMRNAWTAASSDVSAVAFTPDGTDPQKGTLAAAGIGTGVVAGDIVVVKVTGKPDAVFMVIAATAASLTVASKRGLAAFTGGTSHRASYLDIGKDTPSFTLAKAYLDVPHLATNDVHSQRYTGSLVSGFNLNVATGQIVTGSFSTVGNGYLQEEPSYVQQVIAAGGTLGAAGTSQPLNASIDVPVVAVDGASTTFCIENFTISLDNGLTPQNCIGYTAPRRYELGTASVSVSANIYLGDQSYDAFMPAKLSQAPVSMAFTMSNADGGYAFVLPAVQLSFPDPSAGGANQPVMIAASGVAKVGPNGASSLRIYKL